MSKVKICGIKDIDSAKVAYNHGASYLGFVFAESKRKISREKAKEIIDQLPKDILKVGVFVDSSLDEIVDIADYCGLDIIQLHGKEKYEYYKNSPYPIIKSVSVKNKQIIDSNNLPKSNYLLFDTWDETMAGGSGKTFNWDALVDYSHSTPYFLAGGLNTNNIVDALTQLSPYAVDVSSGVETNGVKDHKKIIDFLLKVKECRSNEL